MTSVIQAGNAPKHYIAMTGKQLFDQYQFAAQINGFGSNEFQYGNILYQALKIEGEENIFQLLEEAEKSGKRIALEYPPAPVENYPEPHKVILI
jgi:hypothetical protein